MGGYRYGFNGMERDDNVKGAGNYYTTQFRQYNPRVGRWLSLDPLMGMFPYMSPYVAYANNPIYYTDPYGLAPEGGGKKKKEKIQQLEEVNIVQILTPKQRRKLKRRKKNKEMKKLINDITKYTSPPSPVASDKTTVVILPPGGVRGQEELPNPLQEEPIIDVFGDKLTSDDATNTNAAVIHGHVMRSIDVTTIKTLMPGTSWTDLLNLGILLSPKYQPSNTSPDKERGIGVNKTPHDNIGKGVFTIDSVYYTPSTGKTRTEKALWQVETEDSIFEWKPRKALSTQKSYSK